MDNGICVIDLDSVIFSAFNPNKVLNEYGIPMRTEDNKRFIYQDKTEEEIALACDEIMRTMLNNSNADAYIAYVKGNNTTDIRLSINPDYKANRVYSEPPKFWRFTKKYLIDSWGAVEVHGCEVDDAVNITRLKLPNAFISAIDGDLLGLQGKHWNWRKNAWITVTYTEAEVKFWSDMIKGQAVDNIKGIPGQGEKAALDLISYCDGYDLAYHTQVLDEYIDHFGEELGIDNFYKNYKSLKILEKCEGFVIPEPIKVNKQVEESF